MSYLSKANLAYSTVAIAPSPALSGTTLTLANGQGSLFPASNFTITIYPPINPLVPVNPLASNAEICLCTSRSGDVLTIVRAQEGTSAKSIQTGWQVANTATKLNFTEIENSIIQNISAGTAMAGAGTVVFSNANGVSFGASGQTITASVNITATGGGGGAAISAGASSQSTGTVVFSNSNGVSFGLNAGVLTASHNGITSQSVQPQSTQPVAASASNGSFAFSTLGFSNANGVTFGTSAGSIVTASIAAGAAAGSIAAGGSTLGLGQVVFSNSNGISFSLNGSTITASHNALTSQSAQAASASNGSFAFQTLGFSNGNGVTFGTSAGSIISASVSQSVQPVAASASNGSFAFSTLAFSNANNVTFGTSAGSIITASVATAAAGNSVNFSAGTTSNNLGSVVFSNSNGVSFGLNGSTVTASVAAAGGAITLSGWQPFANAAFDYSNQGGNNFMYMAPLDFPAAVQFDRIGMPMSIAISGVASTATLSLWAAFYTKNASTFSLAHSISTAHTMDLANASRYVGNRIVTIPWTSTISAGNYQVGIFSQVSGVSVAITNVGISRGAIVFNGVFGNVSSTASSNQQTLGIGFFSASTNAIPNSIGCSEIFGSGTNFIRAQVFNLISGTA